MTAKELGCAITQMYGFLMKPHQSLGLGQVGAVFPSAHSLEFSVDFQVDGKRLSGLVFLVAERALVCLAAVMTMTNVLEQSRWS